MGQWVPAVDQALGGIGDAFKGITGTAGDAAGNALGGLFGPFANFLLKMAALALVTWAFVKVVA